MGNFVFPKLPNLNNLNINPLNPYFITITAVLLSGFSILSYHYCFGAREESAPMLEESAPTEDSLSLHVPKRYFPTEDKFNKTDEKIEKINHTSMISSIPDEFDARIAWPQCKEIIGKVWDQGTCQSCWAVSAASVMSDRICIGSNATSTPVLSPQHLICSCENCTKENPTTIPMRFCLGGDSEEAWEFWRDVGLVTGGDYGTNNSCLPYLSPPCIHNPLLPAVNNLVQCSTKIEVYTCPVVCTNSGTSIEKEKKYKGARIYYVNNNEVDIQKEILQFGPVQAKFTFDEKPLMQHVDKLFTCPSENINDSPNIHSIKIIGWGSEDNTPYWLCINSYNKYWGEQGTFKIQRGVNMCRIEESIMAGLPQL